jgi:hypothetical protein
MKSGDSVAVILRDGQFIKGTVLRVGRWKILVAYIMCTYNAKGDLLMEKAHAKWFNKSKVVVE